MGSWAIEWALENTELILQFTVKACLVLQLFLIVLISARWVFRTYRTMVRYRRICRSALHHLEISSTTVARLRVERNMLLKVVMQAAANGNVKVDPAYTTFRADHNTGPVPFDPL